MLRSLGAFILDILQIVVFAVAIFLFVYLLILQPHKIHGKSMFPNFDDGEFLLTDKISYRFNKPARGDVIVFKSPDGKDEYIKRIIGIPSETIKVQDGKVYINGKEIVESYLSEDQYTNAGRFAENGKEFKIPEDSYFVMGDNRDHSLDSRAFGFIEREKIVGKAWFVYWPPNKSGLISVYEYSF